LSAVPKSNPVADASAFFAQCLKAAPGVGVASADVMTVVYDLGNPLGKQFTIDADGNVVKRAAVSTSWAAGMTFHVPDAKTLKALLLQVGDCRFAALINAGFPAVPIGREFRIGSRREIQRLVGSQANPDAVHTWQGMVLVARIKEQTRPSTWQLIDRDVDGFTPEAMRVGYDEWLAICDRVLPRLALTTRVIMPSSSARVLLDGHPVGGSNGHTWVRIADAADVDRTKAAILARSITQDMAWLKPRFSRETGEVLNGRGMWCCPLDTAVWARGRLCFDGQPVVGKGLTLAPLDVQIVQGEQDVLDTVLAQIDTVQTFKASRAKGTAVRIKVDGRSATIVVENLRMDTCIELEDGTLTTVAQLMATTPTGAKVRCQAPFRASQSMAAFFALNGFGQPRVFDVGTGTLHVLQRAELPGCDDAVEKFVKTATGRVGHIVGDFDAGALAVNTEALVGIITSTSWMPDKGKVSLINTHGRLIGLTEKDYARFGQFKTFERWIDADAVMPFLYERLEKNPLPISINTTVAELEKYEVDAILVEIKLHRQVQARGVSVDMFAPRASMNFVGDRQVVVLPFARLRCNPVLPQCTDGVIRAVAQDYAAHWPMLSEWLDCLVAARFASDRRKAFQWLHAPASWGKGFLTDLLRAHGLLFDMSVKEVDAALEGKPAGLSPEDTLTAWILFVDEWKRVSSEIKQLNRQLTLAPKNQLRTTIPLYLKLFASAESVSSLVSGGVEKQFADRFSLLAPKGDGVLGDRELLQHYGRTLYFEAMVVHVGREIMRRVDEYLALGFKGASDKGDVELDRFHAQHGMAQHFPTMAVEVERVAEGVVAAVSRYVLLERDFAAGTGRPFSQAHAHGGRRLNDRLRACAWGFVTEGEARRLALVSGNVEALIRAFLEDEGTSPSMMLKLDYKVGQIVEMVSTETDEPVRVYDRIDRADRGDGSTLKARIRGRVIFVQEHRSETLPEDEPE
jgi:hypothetical protein